MPTKTIARITEKKAKSTWAAGARVSPKRPLPARTAKASTPAEADAKPKANAKPKTKASAKSAHGSRDVAGILRDLEQNASATYRADMATRYGIVTQAPVQGVPVGTLRTMAKNIGRDHALADELWSTGVHDARMLATMIADPALVTAAQMQHWAKGFDNWALVDTACFGLFDRSPLAFAQIEKWSKADDEYVKRAAFALLACCALHGQGSDAEHLRGLELIEREASDARNFVKKAVSWALRSIGGKKSVKLRSAARALAGRLAPSSDPTERWIGKDAQRAFAKAGG